jgi:NitT/TauT family transport system substrate-binding protein
VIAIFVIIIVFNIKDKSNLKKVKVAEVTHSVFYAPQYVAHSLGYFEDEGLDVEIILTPGADAVAAAVLSGDVQIGFCGSEQTIYIYNRGEKDYLVNFSALTKKDGSFLISREENKNFKITDLKGSHIIAGRKGGMPSMTLKWALNQNKINTDQDLKFDTSIAFASMNGAFIGGTGDYVTAFEPSASQLVNQGYGYIVASIGEMGGNVPYTTYSAKKSYIKNNKDVIKGFTKATQKGLDYVHNHSAEEIADVIGSYFPDVSYNDLVNAINKYIEIDSWYDTTKLNKKDFSHIQEIIKNDGELEKEAPFNKLVDNSFSK